MANKLRKRDYPLQIYGVIIGSIKWCDDELKIKIDNYIKKHNELYKKRRAWLKYGIKSYDIIQYNFTLTDERSNAYVLSYIVNFYK